MTLYERYLKLQRSTMRDMQPITEMAKELFVSTGDIYTFEQAMDVALDYYEEQEVFFNRVAECQMASNINED